MMSILNQHSLLGYQEYLCVQYLHIVFMNVADAKPQDIYIHYYLFPLKKYYYFINVNILALYAV